MTSAQLADDRSGYSTSRGRLRRAISGRLIRWRIMATDVSGSGDGTALTDFGNSDGWLGSRAARRRPSFFGVSGYGQKFVYVVDCSGSMSEEPQI